MNKELRQTIIKQAIAENKVSNQVQLQDILEQKYKLPISQGTISNDLKELCILKVKGVDNTTFYQLRQIEEQRSSNLRLRKKMKELVVFSEIIDKFLFIMTEPGNAHVIGSLIDSVEAEDIVGCIAGNDSLLVLTRSEQAVREFRDQFL